MVKNLVQVMFIICYLQNQYLQLENIVKMRLCGFHLSQSVFFESLSVFAHDQPAGRRFFAENNSRVYILHCFIRHF